MYPFGILDMLIYPQMDLDLEYFCFIKYSFWQLDIGYGYIHLKYVDLDMILYPKKVDMTHSWGNYTRRNCSKYSQTHTAAAQSTVQTSFRTSHLHEKSLLIKKLKWRCSSIHVSYMFDHLAVEQSHLHTHSRAECTLNVIIPASPAIGFLPRTRMHIKKCLKSSCQAECRPFKHKLVDVNVIFFINFQWLKVCLNNKSGLAHILKNFYWL